MSDWTALAAELDAWADAPEGATFWWRDDDLTRPGPRIARLVALSDRFAAPVLLAVIPRDMDAGVAGIGGTDVWFCQHGWAHADHSTPPQPGAGRKKIELGGDCDAETLKADLQRGWAIVSALPGGRVLPVLVPPWNRIAPWVISALPQLGYTGWSGFGPRAPQAVLRAVNVHVDPIDWRGGGGFVGEAVALGQVVSHLATRRAGTADRGEPTGLMTHHGVHDPAIWAFVAGLLEAVASHPHARWVSPSDLFAAASGTA